MKSITDIQNEIEKDLSYYNKNGVGAEIYRTPNLFNKYLKFSFDYRTALVAEENKLNELLLERYQYYTGKATSDVYREEPFNDVVTTQADIGRYLDADAKICAGRERLSRVNEACDMIKHMVDSLKYRDNSLKAIHDINVFESGA